MLAIPSRSGPRSRLGCGSGWTRGLLCRHTYLVRLGGVGGGGGGRSPLNSIGFFAFAGAFLTTSTMLAQLEATRLPGFGAGLRPEVATYFLPRLGAEVFLWSGVCVSTDPASRFAAAVEDFCCSTFAASDESSLDDFSFLAIAPPRGCAIVGLGPVRVNSAVRCWPRCDLARA